MDEPLRLCLLAGLFGLAVAAAYLDLARGVIADACTYPALAAGLVGGYALAGEAGLSAHLQGLVLALLLFLPPFLLGLVGGGDVKAAAAVGGLGGPHLGLVALILASFAAAGLALAILAWRGRASARSRVPFGLALAVGIFWSYGWCFLQQGAPLELMERGVL